MADAVDPGVAAELDDGDGAPVDVDDGVGALAGPEVVGTGAGTVAVVAPPVLDPDVDVGGPAIAAVPGATTGRAVVTGAGGAPYVAFGGSRTTTAEAALV